MYNRSRGPDLQWADNKATEAKDQGEAFGIRIGHGSQGSSQKAIEKKQPRWVCSSSLSLSFSLFPSLSHNPPLRPPPPSLSLFSGSRAALKHPLFRPILSHSIRICLSYRRPSATIPIRSVFSANTIATDRVRLNSIFSAQRRRHLTRAELKKVNWGRGARVNIGGREGVMRSIWTGNPRSIFLLIAHDPAIFFFLSNNIVMLRVIACLSSARLIDPISDILFRQHRKIYCWLLSEIKYF